MEIKFDVYFKKNLGTLFKENEVYLDGVEASVNIDLTLVDGMKINYKIGENKYTDDVLIKGDKLIQIPFKSDVVKKGFNEFEIVAYMKNGDVKISQTYVYDITESIGEGDGIKEAHSHPNLEVLNSITEAKLSEWDSKAEGKHGHSINDIEGLEEIEVDLSNYYTKGETDNKILEEISKIEVIKGDTGPQGIQGPKGEDGITPNIQIGTVTTLESNQQATVENVGTKENPIFNFAIPKGQDGEGNAIDDTTLSTETTWSSSKIEDFVLTNDDVVWTEVNGENLSIDYTKEGYLREVEIWGNTIQNEADLSDIQHLGELYVNEQGEPILDELGREQYKIEIDSCNENIVGGEFIKGELTIPINIKQNSNIYYSSKNFFRVNLNYKDGSNTINSTPVLQSNGRYGRRMVVAKDVVSITSKGEGEFVSIKLENNYDYTPHKSHKTTILLPCQLMKVGDVYDRLYWDNEKGKYVVEKNCMGEIVASSKSNPIITEGFNTVRFRHLLENVLVNTIKTVAICNRLPSKDSSIFANDIEGITSHSSNSEITFRINKEKLETIDNIGFNKWLSEEETWVYYQAKNVELIETNITTPIKLPTYIDKTHVFVTGGIDGSIKAKFPLDGGQAILSLSQQNKELKEVNQEQDELINISLLATDEMYMMIEPLLVNTYNIEGNSKMIEMYVVMVQRNLKTIEEIPLRYKEEVIKKLES